MSAAWEQGRAVSVTPRRQRAIFAKLTEAIEFQRRREADEVSWKLECGSLRCISVDVFQVPTGVAGFGSLIGCSNLECVVGLRRWLGCRGRYFLSSSKVGGVD
jgi:hypothetical protein